MKLVVTIDLDKIKRPTKEGLEEYTYESELDFWHDRMVGNPMYIFDNATWELVE